jgi:transposase
VIRYNESGLAGLSDRVPPGPAFRLAPEQMAELAAIVEAGPDLAVDHVVRWRRVDLRRVIAERWGVAFHERTIGKLLHRLGFASCRSDPSTPEPTRPRRRSGGKKASANTCRPPCLRAPSDKPIEVWFADEAAWASRARSPASGHARARARAPRTAATLGPTSSVRSVPSAAWAPGLVMPYADTQAMTAHLPRSALRSPRARMPSSCSTGLGWHAQPLGRAGQHHPAAAAAPQPRAQPGRERLAYLRQNWLSLQVWDDYPAIVEACCQAWTASWPRQTSCDLSPAAHGRRSMLRRWYKTLLLAELQLR